MKRRDSLKALTLSSLGFAAMNPQEALAEAREIQSQTPPETPLKFLAAVKKKKRSAMHS